MPVPRERPYTIDDIEAAFAASGHWVREGEPVTQLEHALQAAQLAEAAGAGAHMITAALLHDLGHLAGVGETLPLLGVDDAHQDRLLPRLRRLFDDRVLQPIRLHVDAKRFLCATRPEYLRNLSPHARERLDSQGGAFCRDEVEAFVSLPYATRAIELRIWDDLARVPRQTTPGLSHFLIYARAAARSGPADDAHAAAGNGALVPAG